MSVIMRDRRLPKTAAAPSDSNLQQHHGPSPFRSQIVEDGDKTFWQNSFDSRVNGLGISNGPFRYEIRHGRTVPQLSPSTDTYDISAPPSPIRQPPPRNPRRRQPQAPTSSVDYEDDGTYLESSRRAPAAAMYGRSGAVEISPPSSPDVAAIHAGSLAGDVSPIEDGPDMFQQQLIKGTRPQKPGTNIPSLRRERRRNQEAAHKGLRESSSKDALRDRNYHPVQHPSATWDNALNNHKVDPGYGLTTTVTGPTAYRTGSAAPPTLGQRMRQLAKGKAEPIDARPPWSGAGGRTGRSTVVDPVRDNLNVAPLSLPRKSSKRAGRDGGPIGNGQMSSVSPSGSDTSGSAATTVRRLLPSRSNQKLQDAAKAASQTDLHAQTSVTHSYPSPPQIDILPMPVSHPPESSGKTHGGPTAAPLLSPNMMANTEKAIRRKPPPSAHTNAQAHHSHLSMSSSVYSTQTDQRNSEIPPLATGSLTSPEDPWVQPPSRFSITTCNTTIGGSPRHSAEEDRPPLPTPPQQAASIMNRRRPLPGGDGSRSSSAEPIVISMKSSIPSLRGEAHKHSRPETGDSSGSRPASIISTSKALPPAPPEVESAHDRVANLNARLDNLAHRRGNINRSIKQMTELMPMDNLLASSAVLRKRELEKQKVEGLKSELAEIQREEYDLGLKLHRAYKRLERGQDFEPTTLWVRRVTH